MGYCVGRLLECFDHRKCSSISMLHAAAAAGAVSFCVALPHVQSGQCMLCNDALCLQHVLHGLDVFWVIRVIPCREGCHPTDEADLSTCYFLLLL